MHLNSKTQYADQYIAGQERFTFNRYGEITRIYVPFTHKTLNIFKEISGPDQYTLQQKLDQLVSSWDSKYESYLKKRDLAQGTQLAEDLQIENEEKIVSISKILLHTLKVNDEVDWESIKAKPTPEPKPKKGKYPKRPELILPVYFDPGLRMGFFSSLFGRKKKAQELATSKHLEAVRHAKLQFEEEEKKYELKCLEIDKLHQSELDKYEKRLEAHITEVEAQNIKIDHLHEKWKEGDPTAVLEHANLVLDASQYPDWISIKYDFQYDAEKQLLKIRYTLPPVNAVDIPKTVRFIKSTGELKLTSRPQKEQRELFDSMCYQIALRTVHELYEADTVGNYSNILFNGIVEGTDPATGVAMESTIMSAIFDRQKFEELNLGMVDPKACFKSFNGVSASSLAGLAPIAPVMDFDTSDKRFIEARTIVDGDNSLENLAAMSWDDFEHLVREIFAKEFESRGGDVKVTQSSSDGGVDAIAFDPDPISGGKIVIQAKRYTKTVGVSAVRDLYGTTLNEGASKGILVTTADFGPDAYKFAADKPLSLLNGANLLFLIEKHGGKARIDLKEARRELGLR